MSMRNKCQQYAMQTCHLCHIMKTLTFYVTDTKSQNYISQNVTNPANYRTKQLQVLQMVWLHQKCFTHETTKISHLAHQCEAKLYSSSVYLLISKRKRSARAMRSSSCLCSSKRSMSLFSGINFSSCEGTRAVLIQMSKPQCAN